MQKAITNAIRKHPLTKKGQKVIRDSTPGFFAIIGKRRRTFYFQCEVTRLGKRSVVKKAIGACENWDAGDARIEALKQIKAIRDGATVKRQVTLGDAWQSYRARLVKRIASGQQSPRTLEMYDDKVGRLLKGWLDVPLRELSDNPVMVAGRHQEITEGSGEVTANMAMKVLRALYLHARAVGLERGLSAELPTSAVDPHPEVPSQRLLEPDDMAIWYGQLRQLPSQVRQEHHLFTLLSGSRTGALRQAKWADLDVKKRMLRIPNPKGGPRRAYSIPLSKPMLRCLWRARRAGRIAYAQHAATYIFAGELGPLSHSKEPREKLSRWGSDLRHSHKTVSVIAEVDGLLSRLLLGHALTGVDEGYIKVGTLGATLLAEQEKISTYIMEHLTK